MHDMKNLIGHLTWSNKTWSDVIYEHGWQYRFARTLSHIINAESAWLKRLLHQTPDPSIFRILTRTDVEELMLLHDAQLKRVISGDMHQILPYTRFNGDKCESTVYDMVMHVISHGFHHRGQLAAFASAEKWQVPDTSYITFGNLLRSQGTLSS